MWLRMITGRHNIRTAAAHCNFPNSENPYLSILHQLFLTIRQWNLRRHINSLIIRPLYAILNDVILWRHFYEFTIFGPYIIIKTSTVDELYARNSTMQSGPWYNCTEDTSVDSIARWWWCKSCVYVYSCRISNLISCNVTNYWLGK